MRMQLYQKRMQYLLLEGRTLYDGFQFLGSWN